MGRNKRDEKPKLWLIVILIVISVIFWIATFSNFSLSSTSILILVIAIAITCFTALQIKRYIDYKKELADKKEEDKVRN